MSFTSFMDRLEHIGGPVFSWVAAVVVVVAALPVSLVWHYLSAAGRPQRAVEPGPTGAPAEPVHGPRATAA
jgi:hypothetical protein